MNASSAERKRLFCWQIRVFALLWSAYASYYLCRLNFAVAQPAILNEFQDWSSAKVGSIPSVYAAVYAIGQFVNGQLGARYGARILMTIAMFVAAIANILMSVAHGYTEMVVLWGINGWAQSAGWSLVVETTANWTPTHKRGLAIGIISTSYQVGNVLSWALAGFLVGQLGWRYAFMIPGIWLIPMGLSFFILVRNRPEDVGFAPVRDEHKKPGEDGPKAQYIPVMRALMLTLSNRILWLLAAGFFCANAVRYAFMNWAVTYMADFHGQPIKDSAFMAISLPLIGAIGAVFAGWASDAFFGGRRAPLSALMLFGLVVVCLAFPQIAVGEVVLATAMLGLAGFLIYGPDMLMSGAATVDFSHPRAAAAATGFTMSAGAAGSIFSGAGVGWFRDVAQGQWDLVFLALAGLALVPALLMTTLWNARPK